MFPERHKQTIDVDPMLAWKFVFKSQHSFFGRGGFYVSPAIRYSMDVDIHADKRLSAGYA